MPIRFACTECGAQFQAPDHLAGKPVACPKCKKKILVPTSAPADSPHSGLGGVKGPASLKGSLPGNGSPLSNGTKAPDPGSFSTKHGAEKLPPPASESGREQDDAIEAFMSQEREKEIAARATTIDFNCSHCDEPLKLPMEMGGKQAPCPSCSRILKVPMPKRTDGAAWKATQNQGPAAVRRDLDPVPEGMQGQARAEVSRETLEEADAVVARPRAPVPIRIRIRQAISMGLTAAVAVVAIGLFLYIRSGQQTRISVEKVVAESVAEITQDKEYPQKPRILLQLVAAQTLIPFAEDVSLYFKKYTEPTLADLRTFRSEAGGDLDKLAAVDVLNAQLITLLLEMGGTSDQARTGKRAKWDDVQQRLQASFSEMTLPEIRLSLWRKMVRTLVAANEANRVLALFNQCFPKAEPTRKNRQGEEVVERSEAAGIMGLEFLKQGDKANAGKSLDFILKGAPALRPSEVGEHTIALAMALNDPQRSLPGNVGEGDLDTQILGQVRGYAMSGDLERAQKLVEKNQNMAFRARVVLASTKPDDVNLQARIARELPDYASRPDNFPGVLTWCEELGPGELSPEALNAVFAKMPKGSPLERELIGWCRYQIAGRKPGSLSGASLEPGLPLGELLRLAMEGETPKPAPDDSQSRLISPFLRIGASKSPSRSR